MKYALLTDNSVQWFTYLVSIHETGECDEYYYYLDNSIKNDYLTNCFNRELSFNNLRLMVPSAAVDTFYGTWISKYDFERIRRMIQLYPSVLEYNKLGKLE